MLEYIYYIMLETGKINILVNAKIYIVDQK